MTNYAKRLLASQASSEFLDAKKHMVDLIEACSNLESLLYALDLPATAEYVGGLKSGVSEVDIERISEAISKKIQDIREDD